MHLVGMPIVYISQVLQNKIDSKSIKGTSMRYDDEDKMGYRFWLTSLWRKYTVKMFLLRQNYSEIMLPQKMTAK